MTLTPSFDPDVFEYTVTTSNNSNKITATGDGDITMTVNGNDHTNGTSATWQAGENTLVIVIDGTTYTVTVTKS